MMMMMGVVCCCCCVLLCSGGAGGAYALRDDLGLTDLFGGTTKNDGWLRDDDGQIFTHLSTSSPSTTMADASSGATTSEFVKDIDGNATHIEYGEVSGSTYTFTAVGAENSEGGDVGRYDVFSVLDSHKGESPVFLERTQHAEKVMFVHNPTTTTGKSFFILVDETHLANGKYGSNDDTCDFAGRYYYTRHGNKARYAWSLVPDTKYSGAYRLASAHCGKKELLVFAKKRGMSILVPPGTGTRFVITAR
jgi:hypothetical protein